MLVTCSQMKQAEDELFATGVEPETLMEQAGLGCLRALTQMVPAPGSAVLFPGKGHNAGDAYVIGRHLRTAGWHVRERLEHDPDDLAPLTAKKRHQFLAEAEPAGHLPPQAPLVLLDGLLGIGAKGPLRAPYDALAEEMTHLRNAAGATVFAVDLPSGVDGDTGEPSPGAVVADVTMTVACVKQGLIADAALDHVGRLCLVPLSDLRPGDGCQDQRTLHAPNLAPLLPPPPYGRHKNAAGQVGLVAGSVAFSGAALLTSLGALRTGSGLLHLYCPSSAHGIIAAKCPPEVILHPFESLEELHEEPLDAIGIGPGLAGLEDAELVRFLETDPRPLVVDAEALNSLGRQHALPRLSAAPAPRLLTPHPGELRRLVPWTGETPHRLETARRFVAEHAVTLLYKGSRTLVAERNRPVSFNTTGHPGMATGGVGDVLTGVLATLLARGIAPYEAASLGSWLIGHAAELERQGLARAPEGLIASGVADFLPSAIANLRRGVY